MKNNTTRYLAAFFVIILVMGTALNALVAQNIITVAGNGGIGYSGDGGPATAAELFYPRGMVIDKRGNMYIADGSNNRIRKINAGDTITTFAGNGTAGYSGDGGPATAAEFNYPYGMAIDKWGNIYIADVNNNCVRMIDTSGTITTIAGNGTAGYSGDGGPATAAELNAVHGVAVDTMGNIYLADFNNHRVRVIDTAGNITTFAGNGTAGFIGDGGPATAAEINGPIGVSLNMTGDLYIGDYYNNRVRMVNTKGTINTIAGNGTAGYSGDGGPATAAEVNGPIAFALDSKGNLYITDVSNNRVRMVTPGDSITTVAGTGVAGFSGDYGPATVAEIYWPEGIARNPKGDMYFVEVINCRVREIPAPLTVTTDSVVPVMCYGDSTGSATVGPAGGKPAYTYLWSDGQTNAAATGLKAGMYTVSVTDVAANMVTDTVNIIEPPALTLSLNTPDSVCAGSPSVINVTAGGGSPGYSYMWSTGATTASVTVTPDTTTMYSVTVTDSNSCNHDTTFTIVAMPLPLVTISIAQDTACISIVADSLTGSPGGGTFSGPGVTGNNFNPGIAGPGMHTIVYMYTDSSGCSNSDSIRVIVSSCTGINEVNTVADKVTFYPNPFSQDINVAINTNGPVTITMFNTLGEEVGAWHMEQGQHVINAQSILAGVYVMQVKTNKGVLNKKLIKVN